MPAELTALVLQGGGALGAYQAGAAERILADGRRPDWVAGISIGAINSALLAGSAPDEQVRTLRAFWERVTSQRSFPALWEGLLSRGLLNDWSAQSAMLHGVNGFFAPRFPPAAMMPPDTPGARSFYDTAPLRKTLEDLVDFDLINAGPMRLSVGAVNVETGNMTWFDSADTAIAPEHILASAALPPGLPPVEIGGALYWDGGLVSNTPLQYVLDERMPDDDLCIFQIDLFSARGAAPGSIWSSQAREKEIRFSSRTRFNTDVLRRLHETRAAAGRLYNKLPPELRDDPDARALGGGNADPHITIAHLIYRHSRYEHQSRDFEFSRPSMEKHWSAGRRDAATTLSHPDWLGRHEGYRPVQVFDLAAH